MRTETTRRAGDLAAARTAGGEQRDLALARVRPAASGAPASVGGRAPSQCVSQSPARAAAARALDRRPASRCRGGRGLGRLDGDEQRIVLSEALRRREQRGAVAGDERRGVGGGEPGERAVDPLGELRERRARRPPGRRAGRARAAPDGVGVLAARAARRRPRPGRAPARARARRRRRGAPGVRQPELGGEALVPERRAVQLRDRGARRAGVARLRRGLGDAGERERQHARRRRRRAAARRSRGRAAAPSRRGRARAR